MKTAASMLATWYGVDPRDRKAVARVIAVLVALIATHSVLAAMLVFSVVDWLLES